MKPRWTRALLAILLVGQLFLLAAQSRDPGGGAGSLLEGTLLRLLGPLARMVSGAGDLARATREATRSRGELAEENTRLRAEVLDLRRERLRVAALDQEVEALGRGVEYARQAGWRLRAAEVVYYDRESWLKTLIVFAGAGGARVDQPVVTEQGVVGRVISTAGDYAKVQLVTDSAASVGVTLERARRQAIARGASGGKLAVELVPRQVTVEVGDRVLTAGIDGVYPRGFPVGTVTQVLPGSEMFHAIEAEPAADLARLAFVYLLDRETPPAPLVTEGAVAPR